MRKRDYVISEFALMLARTAVVQWLFYCVVLQTSVKTASLNGFALLAFFAVSHALLRLLLKRSVNVAVFAAGVIVFAVGLCFLAKYIFVLEPFDPDVNITVHIVLCASALVNGGMAYKNDPAGSVIGRFDLLVILLTILLFASQINKDLAVSGALTWCLAAMAFTVAASAYSRASAGKVAGRGGEAAGKIGIAVLLAFVCTAAGLVISKIQNGSRKLAEALFEGIKSVFFGFAKAVAYICSLIYRFFLWFSSFGKEEEELLLPPPEETGPAIPVATEEIETVAPLWFKILLAAAAVVALIFVFRKLSGLKFKAAGAAPSDNVKRESMLWIKMKALWNSLCDKLSYALFCISKRNTVPGLLAYCEKKAPGKQKRKPSESAEKFLRRLAETASEEDRSTLLELAALCEKHYYSPSKQSAGREICTAVRRLSLTKSR